MNSKSIETNLQISCSSLNGISDWIEVKENMLYDLQLVLKKYKITILENELKFISTWLLEADLFAKYMSGTTPSDTATLSRGRAVNVNAGVMGIGREQKYPHVYIILGECDDMFIGVPITNMAYDNKRKVYYIRHFYEVELINPMGKKPYNSFWCNKRSVADVRNISGIDKRRIIKNDLYNQCKFIPNEYLSAISEKIKNSLAI